MARPCGGTNSNICVAEGCYGESCMKGGDHIVKFRKNPIEFEAIQFTGDNWDEMLEFCGTREFVSEQKQVFGPIGNNLHWVYDELEHPPTGELWVEANQTWLPISVGEWVIQDSLGFYPCKDEVMKTNNTPVDDECTCEAPTFEQELAVLINKHSMENLSGTPDWILANYLSMVLRQFDCAVMLRANWRGESTELPALQKLDEDRAQVERTYEQIHKLFEQGIVHINQPFEYTDLYRELTDHDEKKHGNI